MSLAARKVGNCGFIGGLTQSCATFSSGAYSSSFLKAVVARIGLLKILTRTEAAAGSVPQSSDEETELKFELLFYLLKWSRSSVSRDGRYAAAIRVIVTICNTSWQWAFRRDVADFSPDSVSAKFHCHICSEVGGGSDVDCGCKGVADIGRPVLGGRGSRGGRGRGRGRGACCRRRSDNINAPQTLPGWLSRAVLLLLNVHVGQVSLGRWTAASPAMATMALWNLLGWLGALSMMASFDMAKVYQKANVVPGLPDSQEEWQRESATRLHTSFRFMWTAQGPRPTRRPHK